MSCLNLRLPPPTKAWKTFTSNLQRKLHKLHKPKSSYKSPKTRTRAVASSSRGNKPVFLTQRESGIFSVRHPLFKKKRAPIFVDKLFRAAGHGVTDRPNSRLDALPVKFIESPSIMVIDQQPLEPGTSNTILNLSEGDGKMCADDDMWESVGLASPLMYRIDERAEEFIAKFRAEMENQEMAARRL